MEEEELKEEELKEEKPVEELVEEVHHPKDEQLHYQRIRVSSKIRDRFEIMIFQKRNFRIILSFFLLIMHFSLWNFKVKI